MNNTADSPSRNKVPDSINFISWNIHDARSKDEGNKVELIEFRSLILPSTYFICIQETKRPIQIEGFRCFNSNRQTSRSGGVCIAVKNEISHLVSPVYCNHPDVVAILINKEILGDTTLLVSAYDSPDLSAYKRSGKCTDESVTDAITDLISDTRQSVCTIVMGDFNARMGNQIGNEHLFMQSNISSTDNPLTNIDCPRLAALPERSCKDHKTNSKGKTFLEFVRTNGLVINNGRSIGDIFGEVTCIRPNGTSMVDYCCTSLDTFANSLSFSVGPVSAISDHRPLLLNVRKPTTSKAIKLSLSKPKKPPVGFSWDSRDNSSGVKFLLQQSQEEVQKKLLLLLQSPINNKEDVTNLNQEVSEIFRSLASSVLKNKGKQKKKNPWYDKECKEEKSKLEKCCEKMSSSPQDKAISDNFHCQRRIYRRLIRRKKNGYKWNLNKKITSMHSRQLNWKGVKRLKSESADVLKFDLLDLHNFYTFFKTLYAAKCDKEIVEHPDPSEDIYSAAQNQQAVQLLSQPISQHELSVAIQNLKNNKSPSLDLVTNEMLRSTSNSMRDVLLVLFNNCLKHGCYPWNTSVTTVLHKKGATDNPDNFRAITLGSSIGKLYSNILLTRLADFRKSVCPDTANQQGFAKGAQTNDHVLTLKTILDKYLHKKKQRVIACFIDYRKAFDTVCRAALLKKLGSMGVCGNFFNSISDMYSHSTSAIKLSGMISQSFFVRIGTEQGHPLSPEFFKMFVDEMSKLLNNMEGSFPELDGVNISHLLWADDIVLLALDRSTMLNMIGLVGDYATKWELEINTNKTKIMVFNSSGRILKESAGYYLLGRELESVREYTYLGITLTANGSLKTAISNLSTKSTRAILMMRRSIDANALSAWALFKLYDALIEPILTYGSPVWLHESEAAGALHHPTNSETFFKRLTSDKFEKVHLKFMKWTLGVHRKATNTACYGETGRAPTFIATISRGISYFDRVMSKTSESDPILSLVAKEQKQLNLKWFSFWENIKNNFPRGDLQRLFVNHWERLRHNQSKLSYYNTVKHTYGYEEYLNLRRFERSEISKLRVSAHDLRVETARYSKQPTPTHCRFCCDDNTKQLLDYLPFAESLPENEQHVLSVCQAYDEVRQSVPENLRSAIINEDPITIYSESNGCALNRFLKASHALRDNYNQP